MPRMHSVSPPHAGKGGGSDAAPFGNTHTVPALDSPQVLGLASFLSRLTNQQSVRERQLIPPSPGWPNPCVARFCMQFVMESHSLDQGHGAGTGNSGTGLTGPAIPLLRAQPVPPFLPPSTSPLQFTDAPAVSFSSPAASAKAPLASPGASSGVGLPSPSPVKPSPADVTADDSLDSWLEARFPTDTSSPPQAPARSYTQPLPDFNRWMASLPPPPHLHSYSYDRTLPPLLPHPMDTSHASIPRLSARESPGRPVAEPARVDGAGSVGWLSPSRPAMEFDTLMSKIRRTQAQLSVIGSSHSDSVPVAPPVITEPDPVTSLTWLNLLQSVRGEGGPLRTDTGTSPFEQVGQDTGTQASPGLRDVGVGLPDPDDTLPVTDIIGEERGHRVTWAPLNLAPTADVDIGGLTVRRPSTRRQSRSPSPHAHTRWPPSVAAAALETRKLEEAWALEKTAEIQ